MESINVVWLKRDRRLQDHAPLAAACRQSKPVLLLYILETLLRGFSWLICFDATRRR